MTLILRIGLVTLAAGVAVGLVLRYSVSARWLSALMLVAAAPWLLHLGYVTTLLYLSDGELAAATTFVAVNLAAGSLAYLLLAARAKRRGVIAAAFPPVLAAVYVPLLLVWFAILVGDTAAMVDNFSYVRLFWATLFVTGALFGFAVRLPGVRALRLKLPDFSWMRLRR